MSIFAISDLHLSFGSDKPMDVFGGMWENHAARLADEWRAVVGAEDTVLIPGDISWAANLEAAAADFDFLNRLPGKKLISKGNHDHWWTTAARFRRFCAERGFDTLTIIRNAAVSVGNNAMVVAVKGAPPPGSPELNSADGGEDDGEGGARLYEREQGRLRRALEDARRLSGDPSPSVVPLTGAALSPGVVPPSGGDRVFCVAPPPASAARRTLIVMQHFPPQRLPPQRLPPQRLPSQGLYPPQMLSPPVAVGVGADTGVGVGVASPLPGFTDIISAYDVDICVYGHLHNVGVRRCDAIAGIGRYGSDVGISDHGSVAGIGRHDTVAGGTRYILVAADHLGFRPLRIYP